MKKSISVTKALIYLNVFILSLDFVLNPMTAFNSVKDFFMVLFGSHPDLQTHKQLFWLIPETIQKGEYYRLLTSTFLHANFIHLLMNMMGLNFLGLYIEEKIGKIKFLSIYLVFGLIASIFSVLYKSYAGIKMPTVGASGAIFGLMGFLVYMQVFARKHRINFYKINSMHLWLQLLIMSFIPFMDNMAHAGGAFAGFFTGIFVLNKAHFLQDGMVDKNVKIPSIFQEFKSALIGILNFFKNIFLTIFYDIPLQIISVFVRPLKKYQNKIYMRKKYENLVNSLEIKDWNNLNLFFNYYKFDFYDRLGDLKTDLIKEAIHKQEPLKYGYHHEVFAMTVLLCDLLRDYGHYESNTEQRQCFKERFLDSDYCFGVKLLPKKEIINDDDNFDFKEIL